jgi:aerobic-type carbon monoxide dehydrogenase small subunit (CoxS/CutS family)
MIQFTVNGNPVSVVEQPGEMLADLLRLRLGLTGTKIACQEDECGACTVLLDGEPVLSCSFPAAKAQGRQIVTIEGLASYYAARDPEKVQGRGGAQGERRLHPLQEAFIQHGAVQCGFCIPGQIMTSAALLEHNPAPSEEEIKYALKDTLCRCAGYPSILGAIQAAAKAMRTGTAYP